MAILSVTDEGVAIGAAPPAEEITLAAFRDGARPEAGHFALSIPNTEDIETLAGAVRLFDAVILEFPAFGDGRAYSQARVLRERLGYRGDIRARGDILCDQALFMIRAGFDSLDIGGGDPDGFKKAIGAYSAFYQPAADAAATIRLLRAKNRAAA